MYIMYITWKQHVHILFLTWSK